MHWRNAICTLKYLNGTNDIEIKYTRSVKSMLQTLANSDAN